MADAAPPREKLASPDVATLPVLLTAAGGLAFLAITMVVFAFVYAAYGPSRSFAPPQTFPEPRLRPDDSATELDQLLAAQKKLLGTYRWANSAHTLAQIPIERAMDIMARRGAKAYDPIVPAASPVAPPPSETKP